jgi:hypothetical protein
MPTNRKRTSRGRRAPPIDANDWAYLTDETPENPFTEFAPDAHWRELWAEHGERITSEWAARQPGTRPSHWWKFSAPRLPTPEGHQAQDSWLWLKPRLQIGGFPVGHDAGAMAYRRAVPDWDDEEPDYQADPPVFESELAYLKRHGLLLPGEGKKAR